MRRWTLWRADTSGQSVQRCRAAGETDRRPLFLLGKGGAAIATTYIRPYKVAAGKTAVQTMEDRFAYGSIRKSWGLCLPTSAIRHRPPAEFLLTKASTRRKRAGPWSAGPCSFRSGRRFLPVRSRRRRQTKSAMKRPCAGQRASTSFSFCTHIDKGHIHNHIYYNSTAQDCSRKFHNFIGSSFAVRRLSLTGCASSMSCLLSKIPKTAQQGPLSPLWPVDRGKTGPLPSSGCGWPSWRPWGKGPLTSGVPAAYGGVRLSSGSMGGAARSRSWPLGRIRHPRLRASTLGPGFDPDDIRAVIAGSVPSRSSQKTARPAPAGQSDYRHSGAHGPGQGPAMSGGPKFTTSNRWPPRSSISGNMI